MALQMALFGYGDEIEAERAYRALGASSARTEILRLILAKEQVSTSDVMDTFKLSRNVVLHHLRTLEREDLIQSRHETHPRGSGPITYWIADVEEIHELFHKLFKHLMQSARSTGNLIL